MKGSNTARAVLERSNGSENRQQAFQYRCDM